MTPDLILSNPPYGKIGVDITKYLMANHNDSQMSILGTKGMFNKHYRTVALEYVQVGEYQYDPKGGKTKKLSWGVKQAILLGWHRKGHTWTEVIPKGTLYRGSDVRLNSKHAPFMDRLFSLRNVPVYCSGGGNTHIRTNLVCTVGFPVSEQSNRGICSSKTIHVCTEQELPQIEHIKWVSEMNPNYIWKVFDSLEEAISAAVYLGSWKTPSDSHNRLKKLGFIDTLIPHEE